LSVIIMSLKLLQQDKQVYMSCFWSLPRGKGQHDKRAYMTHPPAPPKEGKRVLSYQDLANYKVDIAKAVQFVKAITVHHDLEYPIKEYIHGDANDNYIVALALQTGSGYIT